MRTRSVTYRFRFKDGSSVEYRIDMDAGSLAMLPSGTGEAPAWAGIFRCSAPRCGSQSCLLCDDISLLVERFRDRISYESCDIEVLTAERNYLKSSDMQTGLFSILGLCMATSGCPYLDFLKPMARFHLPFSTLEETAFRAAGSFLLRRYFRGEADLVAQGGPPRERKAQGFEDLVEAYREVSRINREVVGHVRRHYEAKASDHGSSAKGDSGGDANANAIIMLDVLAQSFSMFLEENLEGLRYLYSD